MINRIKTTILFRSVMFLLELGAELGGALGDRQYYVR